MAETAVKSEVKELYVGRASRLDDFDNDSRFNADDRNVDNSDDFLRGIAQFAEIFIMIPRNLWHELCSYENLFIAYQKARKHKTTKEYVLDFEKDLKSNLFLLRTELLLHCYKPKPLIDFIIRDPKTRKISKSDFRDRIVHHALCNVIEPIFEKCFIYDSYANQINKGPLKAIKRFDFFKRKVSSNNKKVCFVLKADIKKYFENVSHKILIDILKEKIKDINTIWLIKIILSNYFSVKEGKGMPLGNLTSQFFANVYLNKLDQFIKHQLKIRYYIRYVDDFIIFGRNNIILADYKIEINQFLNKNLEINLHSDKSEIVRLKEGVNFLGFRIFYYHKLLKKSNLRKMKSRLRILKQSYNKNKLNYDDIYDSLEGWFAHIKNACTYKLRKQIAKDIKLSFPGEISKKELTKTMPF